MVDCKGRSAELIEPHLVEDAVATAVHEARAHDSRRLSGLGASKHVHDDRVAIGIRDGQCLLACLRVRVLDVAAVVDSVPHLKQPRHSSTPRAAQEPTGECRQPRERERGRKGELERSEEWKQRYEERRRDPDRNMRVVRKEGE